MASLLSPILYLVYDLVMVVRAMRKSEGGIKGAMGRSGSFRLPHSPSSRSSMRREGQASAPATAPASASASVLDAELGLMHRDATDNEQRAATKITSVAKGKASRKKSESERDERERVRNERRRQRQEAKAASTINAAARGKISRRDSMSKQSERKAARDRSRKNARARKLPHAFHLSIVVGKPGGIWRNGRERSTRNMRQPPKWRTQFGTLLAV